MDQTQRDTRTILWTVGGAGMMKREEKRPDSEIKTHRVMLNDRIQTPDGKVFVLDSMELSLAKDDDKVFPIKASFNASGRFLGTENSA